MQDSIEDYLKLSKNTKQDESVKISKEAQLTAQRKKDCDVRALKIVEFSIDGRIKPEVFVKCLPFINQAHYQDIVEERAITKLCGYSLCDQQISDMPKKQFFIHTKSNKVYDITDRKNFCSNFCYKASLHIKKQIDNSPLWTRKFDEIPPYRIMPSTEKGLPGEYIDQGVAKSEEEPSFTPVSIFTTASLTDLVETELNPSKSKKRQTSYKVPLKILKNSMQTINEIEQAEEQTNEEEENLPLKTSDKKKVICNQTRTIKQVENKQLKSLHHLPSIDESEEKSDGKSENTEAGAEKTDTSAKTKPKRSKNKVQPKPDIEGLIKKSLNEWITLDTYIFIYGEAKVKEILSEKKLSNYFETLHLSELDTTQQVKYMNICKRLQLQEMADEKFDKALIGNTKLLPVPDYKKLKEENQDITLKVKAFYGGVLYEKEDANFPTAPNQDKQVVNDDKFSVIPLVDCNSQNAFRRKIFLNSINKAMQQLVQTLRIQCYSLLMQDIQALVKTFTLQAHNIIFKPMIWNYFSLIFLHMLSIRTEEIQAVLERKRSQEYIEVTLSNLPNKTNFINDVMTNFKNIELFIETYVTSKEM